MPIPSDLVHETSTTTGTGNFTLTNVNGKRSFNTAFGTGGTDLFDYYISNQGAAEWERGTGHLSASTTLVRDTVIASSNSNSAVSFSSGTKDVTNDVPAAFQGGGGFCGGRLTYVSTTSISFARYSGFYIFVNGRFEFIPAAGITMSNSGLTAATLYYVYAYMSSGTLTLEGSTTASATDSTYGHKIKSGDATRTLVGMVYMDSGSPGTFANTSLKRYTASYYNRLAVSGEGTSVDTASTTSATHVAINSTNKVEFVCWNDEEVWHGSSATLSASFGVSAMYLAVGIDGTADASTEQFLDDDANGIETPFATFVSVGLSTGYHYSQAFFRSGTGGSQVNAVTVNNIVQLRL